MSQLNQRPIELELQSKIKPDSFSTQPSKNRCPVSSSPGKAVQNQTLKALLSESLRAVFQTEYYFCADKDCPVVYFTADGTQTFKVNELREAVYQKEPDNPDVWVCYCFKHRVGDIKVATAKQRQEILEDIKEGIKADQCACNLRNPQGTCCLGNVSKLISQLEKTHRPGKQTFIG